MKTLKDVKYELYLQEIKNLKTLDIPIYEKLYKQKILREKYGVDKTAPIEKFAPLDKKN
jgi:hypothetical protein